MGFFLEDVVVVGQASGVGQEVSNTDVAAEALELGEVLNEVVIVGELAALGENHDRHRGELF